MKISCAAVIFALGLVVASAPVSAAGASEATRIKRAATVYASQYVCNILRQSPDYYPRVDIVLTKVLGPNLLAGNRDRLMARVRAKAEEMMPGFESQSRTYCNLIFEAINQPGVTAELKGN